ncbi:MAG: MBL fold metallo-hydrolase [Acidaminococcales bacterium]|nr:MBL fold metallo-hydrolase [Acidaminococcales bacterium]
MKVTVLVENTVSLAAVKPLLGQHGLSMLLDIPNCGRILFDSGSSDILIKNLLLMDIVPDSVDYAVLTHGHYAHCGGLLEFLRSRSLPLTVFAGPGIFSPRYMQRKNGPLEFVGMPYTKELLTSAGAEFIFVYGPTQIRENIWLSGPIPKTSDFEKENVSMLDANGQTDRFTDEVAFYVLRPEGLAVFSGGSHRGLVNSIKYGQRVSGAKKIHAVVGGSHLAAADSEQQEATLAFLKESDINMLALNHCTGLKVQSMLLGQGGVKFVSANAGDVLEL